MFSRSRKERITLGSITQLFRTKNSKQHQFTELLRPHVDLMYRMAYRWARSEHDAEDIVQEVLIRLADRVEEMQAIEQLRPWLLKCVYRRFVDVRRSHSSSPISTDSSLNSSTSDDDEDYQSVTQSFADSHDDFAQMLESDSLSKALDSLDDLHREVILLHDLEGYSAIEVADIIEEKVGTVKSRLHRAREKLKIILINGTF